MKTRFLSFDVLSAFVPALVNGDWQGLDASDCAALSEFMRRESDGLAVMHWSAESSDDSSFGTCDASGLRSNLSTVSLVYREGGVA